MPRPFIARQDAIGLGKEATPGTAVAPTAWLRQAALTFDQKTTDTKNDTALGVVEGTDESVITGQWAEGSLQGIVSDTTLGLLLLNMFGSAASVLKAGESTVYNTTFSVNQNANPPALTIARVNPNTSRRHALGYQSDFQIDVKQEDYARFTSTLMARTGVTNSDTPALNTTETRFTSKHVVIQTAANVAGLASPTTLQVKSISLKISRKQDRFIPLGAIDPASFDPEDFNVTGSFVLRYTDTTLEALGLVNGYQALRIALTNTDATIGSASNPALVFTLPKVWFSPITLDNPLNQVLSQTINFEAKRSTSDGYMAQAVLTNTQNGY